MNQSPNEALPRLLVVEDDPVSAAFLHEAASALPAMVECAGCLQTAADACKRRPFDLLLVDANLPDGRGDDLLRALRADGIETPALAHTADSDAHTRSRLLEAGFREVLRKPMSAAELHAALRTQLQPCWDDAVALAALGGNPDHVAALRALLRQELPGQRQRIDEAARSRDAAAVSAELHRLAASCGFVGAAQLGEAVRRLRADPLQPARLQALQDCIDALLGASHPGAWPSTPQTRHAAP